ncbi:MAG: pyruvate dehydrogenase [Planctomycetaceae bacterium]|nr:MAG: pyruvate dehydrogenase [Planctomycetaceae bacterium]
MANAVPVKLPEIGDGIESGDILDIFVSEGDMIEEGQDIVEVETDKATVPVPASTAGKVVKIMVKMGDSVPIGGTILEVEPVDAAASEPESAPAPEQSSEASAPEAEAEAKPEAETESEEETPTPEPAAAKPAPTKPAATAPETAAPAAPSPAPAPAPAPKPAAKPESASPASTPPRPAAPATGDESGIPAGPAIRRLAREVGIDLNQVTGTGEGGRITREDVLTMVRQASQAVRTATAPAPPAAAPSQPAADAPGSNATASDDHGPIRVERMTKIRKTIAAQMHASWSNVPRVTNFDDADVTELERLRQASKDDYAAQGLKLTTMPFLIKAVATALRHHPEVNATIDSENQQIIYKEYVNLGIAVDTDRGLVVPVIRGVDRMGIPEITRHLAELSGKVRSGQFAVNELRGGTFTISNLGAIGGQYSTPIVNIPEVAILLVGRSRKLPVVMPDDSIRPRLMMPLSLSYDHRLVDGGTAARFLNDVIGYLEAPSRLLLAL